MSSSQLNVNEYAGNAIRQLRLSKNMTLSEVARKVSISYQQLQKYEKGTNRLSIDKLYEIAKFLGIEVYNFFPSSGVDYRNDDIQKIQFSSAFSSMKDEENRELILKLMSKLGS